MTDLAPIDIAEALIGAAAESIETVGGGRNSRVYRVRSAGTSYALKRYPPRTDDPRDRLGTEAKALKLMERHHLDRVPRFIRADEEQGFALLTWLDGIAPASVAEADIDQAASFLDAVHGLRRDRESANLKSASEACVSGHEIVRQIGARLAKLESVAINDPELGSFLKGPFAGKSAQVIPSARDLMAAGFDADLPQERRSLAPSDFGFHNSMRQPDGRLAFFDFEYFGWDDPVKLTADIMLHPGTTLAPPLRLRFRRAAESIYGDDPGFFARLAAYYPLFGLRWVLILLNEFLPNRWRQRVAAGATDDWAGAKKLQLAKAQALLGQIEEFV